MTYEPGIDLVVVNYRTPNDLIDFCKSYAEHEPTVPSTLYIVNNDPTDDDDIIAKQLLEIVPDPVFYISTEENIYYSGACNRAGQMGNREVVAFFNADTRFMEGTIDKCHAGLMDHPEWGVLGPLQVGDRGEVTHAGIFGTLDNPQHRGWLKPATAAYADVRDDAVTVSGSAYFTKRHVWDEMLACETYRRRYPNVQGPLLPTTHYYEETWFSYHAQAHGWKIAYFGETQMIHRWHKASEKGGWADKQMPISRKVFREMCDLHNIPRD